MRTYTIELTGEQLDVVRKAVADYVLLRRGDVGDLTIDLAEYGLLGQRMTSLNEIEIDFRRDALYRVMQCLFDMAFEGMGCPAEDSEKVKTAEAVSQLLEDTADVEPENLCDTCVYGERDWYEVPCVSCTAGGTENFYAPMEKDCKWTAKKEELGLT